MICNYLSPDRGSMPALKIGRFLSTEGDFQPVMAKAREIDALASLLADLLPPELAAQSRVANFKDGTLVILAANGPVAAKLKLLSGQLSEGIAKLGAKVNSVSVRVQPGAARTAYAAPHKQAQLSRAALLELAALHARLPESPFRKSLKKLLDKHPLKP